MNQALQDVIEHRRTTNVFEPNHTISDEQIEHLGNASRKGILRTPRSADSSWKRVRSHVRGHYTKRPKSYANETSASATSRSATTRELRSWTDCRPHFMRRTINVAAVAKSAPSEKGMLMSIYPAFTGPLGPGE
jgi:hypothetical protein